MHRTNATRNAIRVVLGGLVGVVGGPAWSAAAHADPPQAQGVLSEPQVDQPQVDKATRHTVDRQWLYVDDARVATPGEVIAMSSVAYTSVGSNPDPTSEPYRAFAFNTAQPGALLALGGELGLLPRLSLEVLGQMELGGQGQSVSPGAVVGLRVDLSPATWRNVHLLASGGYLRETWSAPSRNDDGDLVGGQPNGDNGAWAEAAVSADIQRLRLGLTAHGEHVFADGRDTVDVMVKAGASYRIVDWLRAGVEWVGQDLEETFNAEAEGGARNFVGPTLALQLLDQRLAVVAGPSLGISTGSPQFLGRLAVAYGF